MFIKKLWVVFTMIFLFCGTVGYAHERNRDAVGFFFLKKTSINLSQVIENVEKTENGKVILFKLEERKSTFQYKMKILQNGKKVEATVDPQSGKVIKTESEGRFFDFLHDKKSPPQTKLSLTDAIQIIKEHYEGELLGGALLEDSNMTMFRMIVVNNDGVFTVIVDANTGELFRAPNRDDKKHEK
jgi:uncharacterized membrane protein YkoI